MLRQEAGRDKGNVSSRAPIVIRDGPRAMWIEKRIAGIQEGGIPAIQFGPIRGAQLRAFARWQTP
jgi:hypothetical protein